MFKPSKWLRSLRVVDRTFGVPNYFGNARRKVFGELLRVADLQ
jgi:hypothetical protein